MNESSQSLRAGLTALKNMNADVAEQLRLMAAGIEPYASFAFASPQVRNIWLAAAELLHSAEKESI